EHELPVEGAEVGALHRVEQVATGAVRLAAARRVAERQEEPAAVGVEPVELERARVEAGRGEARELRLADPSPLRLGRLDLGEEAERRVVVVAGERVVTRER